MDQQYSLDDIRAVQVAALKVGGMAKLATLASGLDISGAMLETAVRTAVDSAPQSVPVKATKPAKSAKIAGTRQRKAAKQADLLPGEALTFVPIGKRPRATADEVAQRKAAVLKVLSDSPETKFSKGDIEKALGSDVDSRTLALLVESGAVKKEGDKRMTRYWVAT